MANGTKEWAAVGRRVCHRMNILGWNQGDLCKATGFSRETVRPFMHGVANTRKADTRAKIAVALGWTGDSIDRILEGGEPELSSPEVATIGLHADLPGPSQQEQLDALSTLVRAHHATIEDHGRRLASLELWQHRMTLAAALARADEELSLDAGAAPETEGGRPA